MENKKTVRQHGQVENALDNEGYFHLQLYKEKEKKEMGERFFETPETNVKGAALNVMRHKMLVQIGKGSTYPSLDLEDVNEVLIVAGLPVIVPEEIKAPELKIIKTEPKKEEKTEYDCEI